MRDEGRCWVATVNGRAGEVKIARMRAEDRNDNDGRSSVSRLSVDTDSEAHSCKHIPLRPIGAAGAGEAGRRALAGEGTRSQLSLAVGVKSSTKTKRVTRAS